jgi:hypothetical protein
MFMTPTTDLHLLPGSQLKNAGTSVDAPATDFDRNPRPNGNPSIGAFQ